MKRSTGRHSSARVSARVSVIAALAASHASLACDVGSTTDLGELDGSNGGQSGSGGSGSDPIVDDDYAGIGCDGAVNAASQPFGAHASEYAAGSILPNDVPLSALDRDTAAAYDAWKRNHLESGCGEGRYYVAANNGGNNLTVSEAHGYGMIITALMAGHDPDARTIFDGMFRFFEDHPSNSSSALMAWYQDRSCNDAEGSDSAADGDLDIAYALLLADKQWGSSGAINYGEQAGRVLSAIKQHDLHPDGYVLLGDWVGPEADHFYNSTRSSDFMPGHFASFSAASGDPVWSSATAKGYDVFGAIQQNHSPSTGLLPDFISSLDGSPSPAAPYFLERSEDGSYSLNACRVPWRLGAHFLTTGDSRARNAVQKINAWFRGETGADPWAIGAGYKLGGAAVNGSGYLSMAFVAPLGVGAMVDGQNQAWLNGLWAITRDHSAQGYYYEDSLSVLAMIVMSGNWWSPETAPCPTAE